jgi:hypothetical protein
VLLDNTHTFVKPPFPKHTLGQVPLPKVLKKAFSSKLSRGSHPKVLIFAKEGLSREHDAIHHISKLKVSIGAKNKVYPTEY